MSNSKDETPEIDIDLEADVPTVRYNAEAYRRKIVTQAYAELDDEILSVEDLIFEDDIPSPNG